MSGVVFAVRRRDLAWAVALVMVVSAVWVARSDVADAGGVPAGEGIAVVYVAVGTGFADSLGVGPGAGAHGAPIIIVPTSPPIPAATAAELVRLDPRSVVIVGGSAVVSDAMEDAIGDLLPNAVVSRLAGANRYETNALFSAAVFPVESWVAVPASAFTPSSPDSDDTAIGTDLAYNLTTGFLLAPVTLPHGAEILELKAAVYDGNAAGGENITVSLAKGGGAVASVVTSGALFFHVVTTTSITGPEIVDNEFPYQVVVSGVDAANLYVRWVSVRYRVGTPQG
jgi:ell wall binding domain 2 (CWB2)